MPLPPFDLVIKDGWKKTKNNRYGEAVVIVFSQSIKEFAPTLEDCDRLSKAVDAVRLKDQANKLALEAEVLVKSVQELKGKGRSC